MKKLLLITAVLFSSGVWADCESNNKNPSKVAQCYETQSYAKVLKNLANLKELSKEQMSYNKNVLDELNTAQKAWLAYRDSHCITYSNYHGEINNHSNCIVLLNNQRAEQLQQDIDAN